MNVRMFGLLAMALAALLAFAACSSQPAEPAMSPEEMSAMIESAVERAMPEAMESEPAMTAQEIQAAVESAVAGMESEPAMTAQEIQAAVAAAVDAAQSEGVSADEIESIVSGIIEESVGADDRDIEGMVSRAVEDAVGDQLTADQVESIVDASLMATNEAIEDVAESAAAAAEAAESAQMSAQEAVEIAEEAQMMGEMGDMEPLIVGNLNGFTGPLTEFATPLRNSVELAAEHVNRAGGVGGASMLIISRDTAVNPVQGVDSARALVDVENSVAIVGALSSGVTIAVANSVMIPKERLIISGASTAPSITVLEDNDYVFRTAPSDAAQGIVLANLAKERGYETAGVIYINNAYGEGLADQFEKTFAENGGMITAKTPHEDAQPTYVSELQKATEGDPDVLVTISYPGQAQVYIREALEGDYADTFLFVDGVKGADWIDAIDGWTALEGTHGTAPGGPDRPEKAVFEQAYLSAFGYPVSHPFMAEHYDAAVLIALAAAKAGTTTDSAAIRDALRDVANAPGEVVGPGRAGIARAFALLADGRDINYEGASGVVDIDANGDVFGPIEIWKVEGGEIASTGRFELP